MTTQGAQKILRDILSIDKNNLFLKYIVKRLRSNQYRGWHISQHNRFGLTEVASILECIHEVVGEGDFAIPPGDYANDATLPKEFTPFLLIRDRIYSCLHKGTINSIKKNFFPDLDRMGLLERTKQNLIQDNARQVFFGKLSASAISLLNALDLFDKCKKYSDVVDRLLGHRVCALAERLSLSDYADTNISIYEFMFILSDTDEDLDKIQLLDSFRRLRQHEQQAVIELVQTYANPSNFSGNKTAKRDFHNWKNQAQQILCLMNNTVYFDVDQADFFRLNRSNTGFFQRPQQRSSTPKSRYFRFHNVAKQVDFELHHIVPFSAARNRREAERIDDYRNLIYIHKKVHRCISQNRTARVVLRIDPIKASFSAFKKGPASHGRAVEVTNKHDALYSTAKKNTRTVDKYNTELLRSVYGYVKECNPLEK